MTRSKHETELARTRQAAHRRRSASEGKVRLEVVLTQSEVEVVDEIKKAHGLQSRGAAVSLLIRDFGGKPPP